MITKKRSLTELTAGKMVVPCLVAITVTMTVVYGLAMARNTKYECTMDEELQRIQGANDVTRARRVSGKPADASAYAAASGGGRHGRHLESMTSYHKSNNRCTLT